MEHYIMSHQTKQISLYMVRNWSTATFVNNILQSTGPPTVPSISTDIAGIQPVPPVYYVVAGKQRLELYCRATNDPQSPNKLRFVWYRDSTLVNRRSVITVPGFYSILQFNSLDVSQHNGTYTCSVDNSKPSRAVTQSVVVIVESK